MTIAFIGDVHGWSDRLDRLLARLPGDSELVFVGDLIDRGPRTPAVLDRVRGLCAIGRARCLLGNHEYALVRGLGVPHRGIPADAMQFAAWQRGYGGQAVLDAYAVRDAADLRRALDTHLDWLAGLPWVLEGCCGNRRWIAVHAGLGLEPWAEQVDALRQGFASEDANVPALFSKARAHQLPRDLPADICIASGHTPVRQACVTDQRILCDTSGGQVDRPLSAVLFPSLRVVSS